MRVTNNMRQQQVLRNLQANLQVLARTQEQVATGKRFSRVSEDPVAAAQVMRADRALRGIDQYRRNITAVRTRLDSEESVLGQLGDLMARARELATAQGSATSSPATRADAAAEVDQIIEQVINLGNTKVDNEFIFGGHQTSAPPFQPDGSYMGDDGARKAEISENYVIDSTHNGRQLLGSSEILSSLTDLRDQLRSGTASSVAGTLPGLVRADDNVQVLLSEVGARSRQIDLAGTNLDSLEASLGVRKEQDQGITIEEATTQMLSVQNTLQAALLSTSRLLNLSLTEYMR